MLINSHKLFYFIWWKKFQWLFFKKIKNAETNANFASGCDTKSDDGCCLAAIDYTADFENLFGRFDAYTKF